MGNTCARGFAVSLAVLFLASAVLAQEPEKKTPVPTTHSRGFRAEHLHKQGPVFARLLHAI